MVQHEPTLELLQHQLRHRICRHCKWQTPGSETMPLDEARPCEAACQVFRHLPDLHRTAHVVDSMLRSPETTLSHHAAELAGKDDEAATISRRTNPLRQYQAEIAKVIADAFNK